MTWGTVKIGGAEYVAAFREPDVIEVHNLTAGTEVRKVTIDGTARNVVVLERYESRVVLGVKRGK